MEKLSGKDRALFDAAYAQGRFDATLEIVQELRHGNKLIRELIRIGNPNK